MDGSRPGPPGGGGPDSATDAETGFNNQGQTTSGAGAGVGPQGGSGAPAPAAETCTTEGSTRCAKDAPRQPEKCTGGHWMHLSACANGEICASDGTCKPAVELCRGAQGEAVCDDDGALLQCNADATAAAPQMCMSPAHCQAGLAKRECAACLPQEYRCSGATLEQCSASGTAFERIKDCPTVGLCNKIIGDCSTAACTPNAYVCMGNTLAKCNADGTALTNPLPCGSGTCDQAGGDCNTCQPGKKTCEQQTVLTCKADGQGYSSKPCDNSGQCIGAGNCVACTRDAHCPDSGDPCQVASCTPDNRCSSKPASDRTPCASGVCLAGKCVACLDDTQCASQPGTTCDVLKHACVSKCGNSVVDEGEECDPPGKTCGTDCHFTTPHAMIWVPINGCKAPYASGGSSNGREYCTRQCSTVSDCPEPNGSFTGCDRGHCSYICEKDDTTCPSFSHCSGVKAACIPN